MRSDKAHMMVINIRETNATTEDNQDRRRQQTSEDYEIISR